MTSGQNEKVLQYHVFSLRAIYGLNGNEEDKTIIASCVELIFLLKILEKIKKSKKSGSCLLFVVCPTSPPSLHTSWCRSPPIERKSEIIIGKSRGHEWEFIFWCYDHEGKGIKYSFVCTSPQRCLGSIFELFAEVRKAEQVEEELKANILRSEVHDASGGVVKTQQR